MRVLIDCSSLQAGGGIQVALSFIYDLKSLSLTGDFVVLMSPQMKYDCNKEGFGPNFSFIGIPKEKYKNIIIRSLYLKQLEESIKPNVIFVVFGPAYYKSKAPKLVGYAIPHYIYEDSPFFENLLFIKKIKLLLYKNLKVYLFKKFSDRLVFETNDSREIFCSKYDYNINRTHVVSNTLNSIFLNQKTWVRREFDFKSDNLFLCLTANYPHKNLDSLPTVIDSLIDDYSFSNFKFIVSLTRDELSFDKKYDKYIEYIGRVPLKQLPALYNSVDILFMPTLLEVFSTTYLEAMFMGVPIVASDMSFARDVCNESALYYNPKDSRDAASKLVLLSNNLNERNKLIKLGRINAKRFGTSRDRTYKYLDIISLLSKEITP